MTIEEIEKNAVHITRIQKLIGLIKKHGYMSCFPDYNECECLKDAKWRGWEYCVICSQCKPYLKSEENKNPTDDIDFKLEKFHTSFIKEIIAFLRDFQGLDCFGDACINRDPTQKLTCSICHEVKEYINTPEEDKPTKPLLLN